MSGKDRKVISLFSGCGGMDLGFEGGFSAIEGSINEKMNPDWVKGQAKMGFVQLRDTRFRTVFANDIRPSARSAWAPYFSGLGIDESTFRLDSIVDLVKRERAGEEVFPRDVDVITGGFPCQDFSLAGKRQGFNSEKSHTGGHLTQDDEPTEENRGKLYIWMKEVIGIVKPKVFIAENVKGLVLLSDAKRIIEHDFKSINSEGYCVVEVSVLNAADYGVPQNRERVIFIGLLKSALRKGVLDKISGASLPKELNPYPMATHRSRKKGTFDDRAPYVSVRKALEGLGEPEQSDDPSQRAYSRAKWMGSHCQGQKEIDLDSIGPTIRSEHHGNIEFRRLSEEHGGKYLDELRMGLPERRLSVRECARIQTFPDSYQFVRTGGASAISASDAYKLIGNAVPPLLAYSIAMRLEGIWDDLFT